MRVVVGRFARGGVACDARDLTFIGVTGAP